MARVTIIIPNWNGLEHLPECLASLRRQTAGDVAIVCVDNASTDGSVAWLREAHPEVQVVEMPHNGGFSTAVNAGLERATGEYVCLLNNDTVADDDWLERLIGALEENPSYAIAASKMVYYDNSERINAAGDVFVFPLLMARNRGLGARVGKHGRRVRVLGACAGSALYRRTLFDAIGPFDEDYFLMSEDTDLNFRALLAGYRCVYEPAARLRHKSGASIRRHAHDDMYLLAMRNQMQVVAKCMPRGLLPLVAACVPWRMLRTTVLVRPSAWDAIPAHLRLLPRRLRAELDGWRLGWEKRSQVIRSDDVGVLEVLRWLVVGAGPL